MSITGDKKFLVFERRFVLKNSSSYALKRKEIVEKEDSWTFEKIDIKEESLKKDNVSGGFGRNIQWVDRFRFWKKDLVTRF